MQPEEPAWKRGGIETTLSIFCLCIANSNIAEFCVVISHPEIPTKRTSLHSPCCCFAAAQIYGLSCLLLSLCHTCSTSSTVLHGNLTEGRVSDSIWKLTPSGTTWYLLLRVEKLIVCIKWLSCSQSSHPTQPVVDKREISFPPARGQWWDTYTCKHTRSDFMASTTGCVSAVLQVYSNRWPETLYCHHAQKGQSSSSSLWALERSSLSAKAAKHLRTVPRDIWTPSWWV